MPPFPRAPRDRRLRPDPGPALWGLLAVLTPLALAAGPAGAEAPLGTAREVRSLSVARAEAGLAVDLTGIVTFSEPPNTAFIQDATAGTFFRLGGAPPPRPGDAVRVRGRTFPGLYLPGIEDARFEILGHHGPPEAVPASFDDLISGRYHYQRVVVEGIVRAVTPQEEGTSVIQLALGSRRIEVRVESPPPDDEDRTDARVRVTGLAAGHINARRQLVAPYLRCAGWSEVATLQPGTAPDAAPRLSAEQLLNFDAAGQGGHRVRVQGTVLAAFPRGELFLRDGEAAIAVRLLATEPGPAPGDTVEAAGFPEMDRFSASLADARLVGWEPAPGPVEPVAASFSQLLEGSRDGDLVRVTATLIDRFRTEAGEVLVLQQGDRSLRAYAPDGTAGFPPGTQLRVAGICQVESTVGSEYRSTPASVALRIRSAADLAVLASPSWWTARRLGGGLAIALVAMLLSALWIALLRRQVAHQTVALRHRIEHEAALEERQRLAREFHDTLEQELAGLSLRLDAAITRGVDAKLQGLLEGSRGLVSRIQTETRNLVSDLRDAGDEPGSLATALRTLAERQPPDLVPAIRVRTPAPEGLVPLPPRTVHHLKMIAGEAVSNALKHAGAGRIDLVLESEADAVVMKIIDDGRGFDAERETRGQPGHFGCMGIRERCARLGAAVSWRSRPGTGTTVEVRLPLSPALSPAPAAIPS